MADALRCQTETAAAIIENGGDYLLNAKGNQETLANDIRDFAQDETFRVEMETEQTCEKSGGRIETRTAFVSDDISWMEEHLPKWQSLSCFGAINRSFVINGKTSNEWHYYISSRKLNAKELLKYARFIAPATTLHNLLLRPKKRCVFLLASIWDLYRPMLMRLLRFASPW
ncbi:MAG: ISAs1 family transposase [Defluviitaleaceae bacterium]|nr:ISAs1 family transposase [Defluviitaleaceae bacterium]